MKQTQQRRRVLKLIAIHAPPSPKCFDSRDRWVIYLEIAQAARRAGRKPFDEGTYRPGFDFCADCTPEWKAQMVAAQRCAPEAYIAALTPAPAPAPAQQPAETTT